MDKKKSRSALAGIGVFLLAKFKWAFALLKWTKFGGTFITMMVSLGAYAAIYGWKFGVAIVYLLFVHEMGHLVAARIKGVKTSPAIFIPFMGALISMKERPQDAATEAFLAYGGPLAGLISFLPAYALYEQNGDPFWAFVVFLGAMINLFNLIPVSPLDGGRIVSVLSTKIWLVGLVLLGIYAFMTHSPLMVLILIIGAVSWWNRARENYRGSILAYEKQKLIEFRQEIGRWPGLFSTWQLKETLAIQEETAKRTEEEGSRRRLIPFLQDEEKLDRERARMDREFAEKANALLRTWEDEPEQYEDGDSERPVPSSLLADEERKASARIGQIDEELHRYRTYYTAPASVKWKVLAAYLILAGVLSLFMLYGHRIMELYR
ncbi:site-2 protease family protein [Cohnella terricola]|uniref:Site-2 protease family protein n=1 Tax=Cohnella terricola TaxID=1289167 RepID=A0A559JNG1_9BACL|nr:site-2 protease family protein [Cohnella terricola]TVY01415.1 site-2 protease family protein [Cohnella terricola]